MDKNIISSALEKTYPNAMRAEAKEAAKLIRENYSFDEGEQIIPVLEDEKKKHYEYLTNDGRWLLNHKRFQWSICCTEAEILKMFKNASKYKTDAFAVFYFRAFVKRTKKKTI